MKRLKKSLLLCLSLVFVICEARAMGEESPGKIRRAFLRDLVGEESSNKHLTKKPENQKSATIVSCTDCLGESWGLDSVVVHTLGNQFRSEKDAVCRAVNESNTPLLMFIGHPQCTAIIKKLEGRENDPETPQYVKDALKALYVDERNKSDLNQGIIANLNDQVEQAVSEFSQLIKNKKLTVVGAIYDSEDDFGRGANRLIFINVNGIINPVQLRDDPDLKGIVNPMIWVGAVEKCIIEKKFIK